jgi:hypothetical protein
MALAASEAEFRDELVRRSLHDGVVDKVTDKAEDPLRST